MVFLAKTYISLQHYTLKKKKKKCFLDFKLMVLLKKKNDIFDAVSFNSN